MTTHNGKELQDLTNEEVHEALENLEWALRLIAPDSMTFAMCLCLMTTVAIARETAGPQGGCTACWVRQMTDEALAKEDLSCACRKEGLTLVPEEDKA